MWDKVRNKIVKSDKYRNVYCCYSKNSTKYYYRMKIKGVEHEAFSDTERGAAIALDKLLISLGLKQKNNTLKPLLKK